MLKRVTLVRFSSSIIRTMEAYLLLRSILMSVIMVGFALERSVRNPLSSSHATRRGESVPKYK